MYPASVNWDRLVALLDTAGLRPQPARTLHGFPAWGAPAQSTAYCPACGVDGALVVEPWGNSDERAVLWCTNTDRCPSHLDARVERDVHVALLDALNSIVRMP